LTAAGARHPDRRSQHLEHAAKLPVDTAVARRAAGRPPERRLGAGNEGRRRIVHRRSRPVDREIVVDVKPAQK